MAEIDFPTVELRQRPKADRHATGGTPQGTRGQLVEGWRRGSDLEQFATVETPDSPACSCGRACAQGGVSPPASRSLPAWTMQRIKRIRGACSWGSYGEHDLFALNAFFAYRKKRETGMPALDGTSRGRSRGIRHELMPPEPGEGLLDGGRLLVSSKGIVEVRASHPVWRTQHGASTRSHPLRHRPRHRYRMYRADASAVASIGLVRASRCDTWTIGD